MPSGDPDAPTLLLEEHRTIRELFDTYERGGDPEARMQLVRRMIQVLDVHETSTE
jgi:hypothetical protein